MIGGGEALFSRFCAAIIPPNVVVVSSHSASTISASGAATPAHSASKAASLSSELMLGKQFVADAGVAGGGGEIWLKVPAKPDRPKAWRNVCQSGAYIMVSSITTMVCPAPR